MTPTTTQCSRESAMSRQAGNHCAPATEVVLGATVCPMHARILRQGAQARSRSAAGHGRMAGTYARRG